MISKKFRLTKKDNIANILKADTSRILPLLVVKFRKNNAENCKFSVIVSKKILNKASKRNRLRRQIYEAIRLNNDCQLHNSHKDSAILVKKNLAGKKYRDIEQQIKSIL